MFDMKNTNILQGKNEIIIFLLNGKVGRLNIYAKSSIKCPNKFTQLGFPRAAIWQYAV